MRRLSSAVSRRSKQTPVYRDTSTSTDSFGQDEDTWEQVDAVQATRTYPNRNTTTQATEGSLQRDRPLFFFSAHVDLEPGDRIKYNSTWYELESPTEYQSHVAMLANAITGFAP